jgi:hypothetical protein
VRQSLIGAILNKADMNTIGRYDRSERTYPGYKNNALAAA